MAISREVARQELARRELERRGVSLNANQTPQQEPSEMGLGEWLKNDIMQGTKRFNKGVEDYAVAPMMGFMQSVANVPSALWNVASHGLGDLGSGIPGGGQHFDPMPYAPYFDVAPHTYPAQAGEAASLALGVGKPIANAVSKAGNMLKKGYEYLSPKAIGKEAEAFRRGIADVGSESENIENLAKRVQLARESGAEEALIPKRQLYEQEGKSNLYNIDEQHLPEGNIPQIAHMIEPGANFGEAQSKALSSALRNYRKNGDVESFLNKSEDLFGVEELPKSAAQKIEDALLMPTKRNSEYFSDPEVKAYYSKKGKLNQLHQDFQEKPTLQRYDKLQSELKKEIRPLERRDAVGTLGDTGTAKLENLQNNLANLEQDASQFFETLPENMKELHKTFSKKWATGPAKYGDVKTDITLQRLASKEPGEVTQVTDNDIIKTFTHPDKTTLEAMKEMGPSLGRNVIYSALNKIGVGKGKQLGEAIIELSRKPGFENWVTPDMLTWSNAMIKRSKHSDIAKKSLVYGSGIAGLSALGGAGIGAAMHGYKQ
jgi:hypothetical protein